MNDTAKKVLKIIGVSTGGAALAAGLGVGAWALVQYKNRTIEGTIVKKEHNDARNESMFIPTVVGKITILVPIIRHYSENWEFVVKLENGKTDSIYTTDKNLWDQYEVGDFISNKNMKDKLSVNEPHTDEKQSKKSNLTIEKNSISFSPSEYQTMIEALQTQKSYTQELKSLSQKFTDFFFNTQENFECNNYYFVNDSQNQIKESKWIISMSEKELTFIKDILPKSQNQLKEKINSFLQNTVKYSIGR